MQTKKALYALVGLVVVVVLCVGAVSAGFLATWLIRSAQGPDGVPGFPFEGGTQEFPGVEAPPEAQLTPPQETPLSEDVDLGALFAPFWESWEILHENYVDQPLDDELLLAGALDGLTIALELEEADAPFAGVEVDPAAISIAALSAEANTPDDLQALFAAYWENWQKTVYGDIELPQDITYEQLMQNSLRGMVDALGDPHTAYMDPFEYMQINIPLEGEYEGIGAWVDTTGDFLEIIAPMEDSPAEKAGLKPGDVVVAIDGDDMSGIDPNLAIRRVLGPAGSTVVLTVEREGADAPFDVEIVRARIVVPSVEHEILEGNIAYVRLYNFGDNSDQDLRDALEEVLSQNPDGLILDLRNNGGGWLDTAVNVASEFLNGGVVLYEEYGDGTRDTFDVREDGVATAIPLVVLVNDGTASASEIVAGAIQDYERGTLVGVTTYGKGSVQLPIVLENEQGALRVTIARWLTPDERLIHDVGLTPDVVVELTEEDFEAGRDPQLDAAIAILLDEIS